MEEEILTQQEEREQHLAPSPKQVLGDTFSVAVGEIWTFLCCWSLSALAGECLWSAEAGCPVVLPAWGCSGSAWAGGLPGLGVTSCLPAGRRRAVPCLQGNPGLRPLCPEGSAAPAAHAGKRWICPAVPFPSRVLFRRDLCSSSALGRGGLPWRIQL